MLGIVFLNYSVRDQTCRDSSRYRLIRSSYIFQYTTFIRSRVIFGVLTSFRIQFLVYPARHIFFQNNRIMVSPTACPTGGSRSTVPVPVPDHTKPRNINANNNDSSQTKKNVTEETVNQKIESLLNIDWLEQLYNMYHEAISDSDPSSSTNFGLCICLQC
jgi:hypothetical protein